MLTAAHCEKIDVVLLGSNIVEDVMREKTERRRATDFVGHPLYRSEDGIAHDIGLVKLDRPVEITENIQVGGHKPALVCLQVHLMVS